MKSQLVKGDSLQELKKYDDNSVDLLCTDPPYGYGFMGRDWDKVLPDIGIFEECFRVLKPGSMAFVMSAPRSDVQYRMAEMLERVGFRIDYTPIYWTYATGFPKAMNISKMIDKRGGQDLSWFIDYVLEVAKKKNITKKELTMLFPSKSGKPTGWLWNKQKTQGITLEQYNKIKDFLKLPFDTIEEAEREVVGKKSSGLGSGKTYAFTDDNNKSKGEVDITIPKTDKAKELDGAYGGFQPKPAVEVVIVAMKPLDKKGYLEQAQDNQKGVTWFDDCRIPFDEGDTPQGGYGAMDIGIGKPGETQEYRKKKKITMPDLRDVGKKSKEAIGIDKLSYGQVQNAERKEYEPNTVGRFPANLLVSDNIIDDGKITKSTGGRSGNKKGIGTYGIYGKFESDVRNEDPGFGDSGGYSRYFSLDAWWSKNLKSLPEPVQQTFPFMIVPKASRSEKDNGLDRNIHPTVKPLTLMSYLVVLGSRKGDVVLEPFAGSGTTALACVGQERDYIAIEREEEYYEIAKARLEKVENH